MSAVNVDIDGVHIWAGDRCGVNSCAESDLDPIVKLDANGNVVAGLRRRAHHWPHGMDVDREGNVRVADAVSAADLGDNPTASGRGHTVIKFSPEGEVLLTLGTPGEAGDPPTHLTQPSDVHIAPDGNIFVAEAHGAQFLDEAGAASTGPPSIGRISKFAPDGTFIKSWGSWGYRDGQFRGPHSSPWTRRGACSSPTAATGGSRSSTGGYAPRHLVSVQPPTAGIFIDGNDVLYAVDSSLRQLQPRLDERARVGSARTGDVMYFIPAHESERPSGMGGVVQSAKE